MVHKIKNQAESWLKSAVLVKQLTDKKTIFQRQSERFQILKPIFKCGIQNKSCHAF
jgi:hypothetical protein